MTVTDTHCDNNQSQNSVTNTNVNEINGLCVYYDSGGEKTRSYWEIYLDTSPIYSGNGCGCGTISYPQFSTDAAHELIVKFQVKDCNGECVPSTSNEIRVYSPKAGNACHTVCQ